jgi:two-component sensor histidine kinase
VLDRLVKYRLYIHKRSIFKKPGINIHPYINVPETLLDIDTAVPLGLIMNELLTNSFKYAFEENKKGVIKIDLKEEKTGEYTLTYSDNGKGIAKDIDIKNTTSLGLRLIHRLSKQLGGSVSYQYRKGSTFIISFKDSKLRNQEG